MAKAVFTSAWWKKNKAATLLDSGDTVEKAMKVFEAASAKIKSDASVATFSAYIDAVKKVDVAAAALMKKANKTLHKETIGYLTEYQTDAETMAKAASKLSGELEKIQKLTLDAALKEKDFETYCKKSMNEEQYQFLAIMGKMGGKGSKPVYDLFIKVGSKFEINISSSLRSQITETDGPWGKAVAEVASMMKDVLVRFKADTIKAFAAKVA